MSIKQITDKIIERSKASRAAYLSMVDEMRNLPPAPDRLSCSNWAHVVAAESDQDKKDMPAGKGANIGIVTAYNDMLSAHQPFSKLPKYRQTHCARVGSNRAGGWWCAGNVRWRYSRSARYGIEFV